MRARTLSALCFVVLVAPLAFVSCSKASEGESCDLASGNTDCEDGLVCLGPWEISANQSVCCPRPPAGPSTSACEPRLSKHEPDPYVDAAPIPPGDGSAGGSGGVGGSAGGGGTAGIAGSAGAAGVSGGGGAAGSGGSAGSSGSDAGATDAALD